MTEFFLSLLSNLPLFDIIINLINFSTFPNITDGNSLLILLREIADFLILSIFTSITLEFFFGKKEKKYDILYNMFAYPRELLFEIICIFVWSSAMNIAYSSFGAIWRILFIAVALCSIVFAHKDKRKRRTTLLLLDVINTLCLLGICACVYITSISDHDVSVILISAIVITVFLRFSKSFLSRIL